MKYFILQITGGPKFLIEASGLQSAQKEAARDFPFKNKMIYPIEEEIDKQFYGFLFGE